MTVEFLKRKVILSFHDTQDTSVQYLPIELYALKETFLFQKIKTTI